MTIKFYSPEEKTDYLLSREKKENDHTQGREEVEGKLLNVNTECIKEKLERLNAIEVFNGLLVSTSFEVGLEFLIQFFGMGDGTASGVRASKSNKKFGVSRFRRYEDDDGQTRVYEVITKVKKRLPEEVEREIKKRKKEYGIIADDSYAYNMAYRIHITECGKPTSIEYKRRTSYIIPSIEGLEYSRDKIKRVTRRSVTKEIEIPPFLEIQGENDETYLTGVTLLDLDPKDLSTKTSRDLVTDVWERSSRFTTGAIPIQE
ncbi:hypothetical protein J4216_00940 [Candidatus Woesearchaeota archaeon]|nr:hypothetical protein [Candidatus Woesearchaeota archaeon]